MRVLNKTVLRIPSTPYDIRAGENAIFDENCGQYLCMIDVPTRLLCSARSTALRLAKEIAMEIFSPNGKVRKTAARYPKILVSEEEGYWAVYWDSWIERPKAPTYALLERKTAR